MSVQFQGERVLIMLKKKVNEEIKWLLQPTKRKELSWFYQMVFARSSPLNTFSPRHDLNTFSEFRK